MGNHCHLTPPQPVSCGSMWAPCAFVSCASWILPLAQPPKLLWRWLQVPGQGQRKHADHPRALPCHQALFPQCLLFLRRHSLHILPTVWLAGAKGLILINEVPKESTESRHRQQQQAAARVFTVWLIYISCHHTLTFLHADLAVSHTHILSMLSHAHVSVPHCSQHQTAGSCPDNTSWDTLGFEANLKQLPHPQLSGRVPLNSISRYLFQQWEK